VRMRDRPSAQHVDWRQPGPMLWMHVGAVFEAMPLGRPSDVGRYRDTRRRRGVYHGLTITFQTAAHHRGQPTSANAA